jgi:TrmH family RNA methyltransferase
MEQITSIKHEIIQEARTLSTLNGRKDTGKILLEGIENIQWAIDAHLRIETILLNAKHDQDGLLHNVDLQGACCYQVSEGILKKITNRQFASPILGIAITAQLKPLDPQAKDPFVLVLDDVRDHGNIGTIIRTASAFGITHFYNNNDAIDPYYKKIIDASRGKSFQCHFHDFQKPCEAIRTLKDQGYQIITTSPHAKHIQSQIRLEPRPIALVLGNETNGADDAFIEQADYIVQIPMSGSVESLNVGVAAGISIYEFKLKLVIAMLKNTIQNTLGREINVTGKLIQMAVDGRLKKLTPFNGIQIILLMILKCDEKMTLSQISKDTASFGDDLDGILAPLQNGGHITVNSGAQYQITEKGEQLLAELWPVIEKTEKDLLFNFNEEEKDQLINYIKRLQQNAISILEK